MNLDTLLKPFTPTDLNVNPYSYKEHIRLLQGFKQAGGRYSSEFNLYDNPQTLFFKILFHFDEPYGLLHPTWNFASGEMVNNPINQLRMKDLDWYNYSTAYSYLQQNDEIERSIYLQKFIELLSNINSESPWYFSGIAGLDLAINRHDYFKEDTGANIPNERRTLTIECMEDSIDQRLTTLMDLYRHMTYSWGHKKEIIPSNLRKFSMSIVLYSMPIKRLHLPIKNKKITDTLGQVGKWMDGYNDDSKEYANFYGDSSSTYMASYKVFEFRNCEFRFNGTAFASINNGGDEVGLTPKITFNVDYEDCYEVKYNEFLPEMLILDALQVDTQQYFMKRDSDEVIQQDNFTGIHNKTDKTYEDVGDNPNSISNQIIGLVSGYTAPKVTQKVVLGNLYGFSLNRTGRAVDKLLDGQYVSTGFELASVIPGNYRDGLERGDGNNRGFIKSKL